jgi:hypothetical protein
MLKTAAAFHTDAEAEDPRLSVVQLTWDGHHVPVAYPPVSDMLTVILPVSSLDGLT